MGIQSTTNITRENAIDRIKHIDYLLFHKQYKDIQDITIEDDYNIPTFVDSFKSIFNCEVDLTQWTDEMLEDKMDEPFYRFSLFDNYLIVEDE